uniref:Small ribosomal subunit protein eS24 n=1 Tax=Fervidicoccus fontis TaxID=683846 RepID=A0A7J3ZLI2_9CREN
MSIQESKGKVIDLGEGISARIVKEKRNNVIGRVEYEIEVVHIGRGTPSLPALRSKLAEKLGVDVKRLYIRKLQTEYGIGVSKANVNVYDTPERALYFEPKYIVQRNKTLQEEIEESEEGEGRG